MAENLYTRQHAVSLWRNRFVSFGASWMNLVEVWLSALIVKRIRGNSFLSVTCSCQVSLAQVAC